MPVEYPTERATVAGRRCCTRSQDPRSARTRLSGPVLRIRDRQREAWRQNSRTRARAKNPKLGGSSTRQQPLCAWGRRQTRLRSQTPRRIRCRSKKRGLWSSGPSRHGSTRVRPKAEGLCQQGFVRSNLLVRRVIVRLDQGAPW